MPFVPRTTPLVVLLVLAAGSISALGAGASRDPDAGRQRADPAAPARLRVRGPARPGGDTLRQRRHRRRQHGRAQRRGWRGEGDPGSRRRTRRALPRISGLQPGPCGHPRVDRRQPRHRESRSARVHLRRLLPPRPRVVGERQGQRRQPDPARQLRQSRPVQDPARRPGAVVPGQGRRGNPLRAGPRPGGARSLVLRHLSAHGHRSPAQREVLRARGPPPPSRAPAGRPATSCSAPSGSASGARSGRTAGR